MAKKVSKAQAPKRIDRDQRRVRTYQIIFGILALILVVSMVMSMVVK